MMNGIGQNSQGAAIVIGASGGIGRAFMREFEAAGYEPVIGLARGLGDDPALIHIDIEQEHSIAKAADLAKERLKSGPPLKRLIVATGALSIDGVGPEKDWRQLNAAQLQKYFALNTIGPALVAKQFLPLLPKSEPAICAFLSARVGSISDNHYGGWYGYRASKAALNMMVKTLAIELQRKRPKAVCVGLHPGTVDTALSKPFQKNIKAEQLFSANYSASVLMSVLDRLNEGASGKIFAWDGKEILP